MNFELYIDKMNRIDRLFNTKKEKILSLYFCAGYPAAKNTIETLQAMQASGIDMVEIGIPFSDPMADGAVIQDASTKSLRNGTSLAGMMEELRDVRDSIDIPLLFMGYLNPIMQYGFEKFFSDCRERGIDGCIIPDLPFDDYMEYIKPLAEKYDIRVIMLITPETSEARIRQIDENTSGFIYMVSSAAVTGAQSSFERQKEYFDKIKGMDLTNPRMIGFGISNRATLQAAFENAAGAIIGSKFVSLQRQTQNAEEAVRKLMEALAE